MLERTEHVTVEACGYGNKAAGMVDRHRTGFDSLCPAISGGLAPDEGQKGAAGCFRRYLDSLPDAERLPLRQIEKGRASIDSGEEQKAWDRVPRRDDAEQRGGERPNSGREWG